MLPDGAHNIEEDSNLFLLKKRKNVQQEILDDDTLDNIDDAVAKMSQQKDQDREAADFYYCLNVIKQKKFQGVRRKARVKSLAIASKYPFALNLRVRVKCQNDRFH